jgi:DNA-binding CsgD family transcriptional regulator/quercetin dioxygenase-like cupin family protein
MFVLTSSWTCLTSCARHSRVRRELAALAAREREVLQLVAGGLSNHEIGDELGLAEQTAKDYVTNVLKKLRVHSRAEAALLAATLTTYAADDVERYRLPSTPVPPRPTSVGQASVDVEPPATALELVHMLVDFEPGMWTAPHMHGGSDLSTVATGAITLERRGQVESFALGDSFVNTPGFSPGWQRE